MKTCPVFQQPLSDAVNRRAGARCRKPSRGKPPKRSISVYGIARNETGVPVPRAWRVAHMNPARASLASRAEEWPWSSVHDYTGSVQRPVATPSGLQIDRGLLPAGGAYVATPVVAMYAPTVARRRAAGLLQAPTACELWLGYPPATPKRAYMPTTTVGTYAPPACCCCSNPSRRMQCRNVPWRMSSPRRGVL
jgi:hypothetical protein